MTDETCSSCSHYIQGDEQEDLGCCLLREHIELVYGDSYCEEHMLWFPDLDESDDDDGK